MQPTTILFDGVEITAFRMEDGSIMRKDIADMFAACKPQIDYPAQPHGLPASVRVSSGAPWTLGKLRKARVERDAVGRITNVILTAPRKPGVVQTRKALADLLAYLDGSNDDDSVIDRARELAIA